MLWKQWTLIKVKLNTNDILVWCSGETQKINLDVAKSSQECQAQPAFSFIEHGENWQLVTDEPVIFEK